MTPSRWELIRDVLVFQVKVVADGLRDVLLGPISLVAALLGLLGVGGGPGRLFYEVLKLGRRSESWIDLFAAADRLAPPASRALAGPSQSIDGLVERLEHLLVEEYERGGVTASAKQAIDRALDAVQIRRAG